MNKVEFNFINKKGLQKKGIVWVDDETLKMISALDEIERQKYLDELYHEDLIERNYQRKVSKIKDYTSLTASNYAFDYQDPFDLEEQLCIEEKIKNLLSILTLDEKEIVKEIFINGVSQKEFGKRKGLCRQNITRKVSKIKEKSKKIQKF